MKPTAATFVLTALAYIIPTMILGMVWHFNWFPRLYDELGIYNRKDPLIPLGFASMIIQGLVMAWLYPYFSGGRSSMAKAIKYSFLMGLFLFSVTTLANAAKIQITSMRNWLLVQTAFTLVQFGIVGILIGLVNRSKGR